MVRHAPHQICDMVFKGSLSIIVLRQKASIMSASSLPSDGIKEKTLKTLTRRPAVYGNLIKEKAWQKAARPESQPIQMIPVLLVAHTQPAERA